MGTLEGSLVYSHTEGLKSPNQDSEAYIEGSFNAIIVADGIGSSASADKASTFVVRRISSLLRDTENIDAKILQDMFGQVQEDLDSHVDLYDFESTKGDFGSTLITAIELEDRFIIGYVGNGGILHAHGNLTEFNPKVHYLPWVCHNHLVCHSISEGREMLNRHFSYLNDKKYVIPSIVEIKKNNDFFGDILVICTDGLFSGDQLEIAKDEEDNYWQEIPKGLVLLWQEIAGFLKDGFYQRDNLRNAINQYFKLFRELRHEMNDDTSLGIIFSKAVIDHHIARSSQ